MSRHWTPGPWTLKTVPTACGICHMIGPFPAKPGTTRENNACVYSDYPGNGPHDVEMLANARLIAAAPELLEACNLMLREFSQKFNVKKDFHKMVAFEEARKAVAKATGEQP